jgi:hypothetical protein
MWEMGAALTASPRSHSGEPGQDVGCHDLRYRFGDMAIEALSIWQGGWRLRPRRRAPGWWGAGWNK